MIQFYKIIIHNFIKYIQFFDIYLVFFPKNLQLLSKTKLNMNFTRPCCTWLNI